MFRTRAGSWGPRARVRRENWSTRSTHTAEKKARAASGREPRPTPRAGGGGGARGVGRTRVLPPFQPRTPPGKGPMGPPCDVPLLSVRTRPPLPIPARGRGPRRGGEEVQRAEAGGCRKRLPLPSRPPFPLAGQAPPLTDRRGRSGDMHDETRCRSRHANGVQPPRVGRGSHLRGVGGESGEGGRNGQSPPGPTTATVATNSCVEG